MDPYVTNKRVGDSWVNKVDELLGPSANCYVHGWVSKPYPASMILSI